MIFNKHVVTKGKVVLYGDSNYLDTYSNTTRLALAILKTMVLRHNKGSYRNKIQFLFAEVVSQGKGAQVLT